MNVRVWSDFICPFCYIGIRRLEEAATRLGTELNLEVMSYELDQNFEGPVDVNAMLVEKYGWSLEQVKSQNRKVAMMAEEMGLKYNFDSMMAVNTMKAHQVYQAAKGTPFAYPFYKRVSKAYFEEGRNISDEDTLVQLGLEVGLEESFVREALSNDENRYKVRQDENWAAELNVRGVPYFAFEDRVSVSGAQTVDHFAQAIEHVSTLDLSKK